jgi:hypothetical protein
MHARKEEQFDLSLSLVLAHTLMYEARLTHSLETGDTLPFNYFRGEDRVPNAPDTQYHNVMTGFSQAYPDFIKQLSGQILPFEQSRFSAAAALAPQEAALMQSLVPAYAQLGQSVNEANRTVDPGYYGLRDATLSGAKDTIAALNPNGLSPGEQEAVSRSQGQRQAQTGTLGTSNSDSAVSNAFQYADKYNDKLSRLGAALGNANNILAGNKPAVDASGAASATTRGFANAAQVGDRSSVAGGQLFGAGAEFANTENQLDSKRRDWADRVNEGVTAVGSLTSGA